MSYALKEKLAIKISAQRDLVFLSYLELNPSAIAQGTSTALGPIKNDILTESLQQQVFSNKYQASTEANAGSNLNDFDQNLSIDINENSDQYDQISFATEVSDKKNVNAEEAFNKAQLLWQSGEGIFTEIVQHNSSQRASQKFNDFESSKYRGLLFQQRNFSRPQRNESLMTTSERMFSRAQISKEHLQRLQARFEREEHDKIESSRFKFNS